MKMVNYPEPKNKFKQILSFTVMFDFKFIINLKKTNLQQIIKIQAKNIVVIIN